MIYLITYDVPSSPEGERRRAKVARKLEAFGIRVQWSVFECELSPGLYRRLREELKEMIVVGEDSIRMYPICATCVREADVIGRKDLCPRDEDCFLF